MFLFARCREPVVLCSRCDRGNRYCGDECSTEARRAFGRDAGRRYQAGGIGRSMHAARSRRWRLQRKAKLVLPAEDESGVTHHGLTDEPVEPPRVPHTSVVLAVPSTGLDTAVQVLWRACPRCAVAVSPFVRQRFLRSHVAATGQRLPQPPVPPPRLAHDLPVASVSSWAGQQMRFGCHEGIPRGQLPLHWRLSICLIYPRR
jgi:hypothetical protein